MMWTSADRLRWLIEFSRMDFSEDVEFKEWEWLKLKEEIIEFIGLGDKLGPFQLQIEEGEKSMDAIFTKEWIDGIHGSLQDFLDEFVVPTFRRTSEPRILAPPGADESVREKFRAAHAAAKAASKKKQWKVTRSANPGVMDTIFVRATIGFHRSPPTWVMRASAGGLFFSRLASVLMDEANQIGQCPECDRIFYRVRKQIYCSKTCINRVTRRKWLENPKNKKKEKQWARERYERRVREKTNGKIRIQTKKGGKE